MRKYERQIAKAHLRAVGVGSVNRKMAKVKDGVKVWRLALMDSLAITRKRIRKPRRVSRQMAQVNQ
jgi:hypothetical protein